MSEVGEWILRTWEWLYRYRPTQRVGLVLLLSAPIKSELSPDEIGCLGPDEVQIKHQENFAHLLGLVVKPKFLLVLECLLAQIVASMSIWPCKKPLQSWITRSLRIHNGYMYSTFKVPGTLKCVDESIAVNVQCFTFKVGREKGEQVLSQALAKN